MKTFTLTLSDDFLDKLIYVSIVAMEDAHDSGNEAEEEVWNNFSDALVEIKNNG